MNVFKLVAIIFVTGAVTRIVEDEAFFDKPWKNSGTGALAGALAGAGVYTLLR